MNELVARVKEVQYKKAVKLMNEYCKHYDKHEEIDRETNTIKMDISQFPESPARMIALGVLERLPHQPICIKDSTILFDVGKNSRKVRQLLEVDLVPPIPLIQSKQTIQIDGSGVLPWLNRVPIELS